MLIRRTIWFVGGVASLAQLACSADGATTNSPPHEATPQIGSLVVMIDERGNGRDADGVSVSMDRNPIRLLTEDAPNKFDSLTVGEHWFRIADVAPQCVGVADSVSGTVRDATTDTVRIRMTCLGGIAYHSYVSDRQFDIMYLGEDGVTRTLVGGPGKKFISAWSPDGSRLAYRRLEVNVFRLYTVRVDGSDTHQIGQTLADIGDGVGRWSPDGKRLAFAQTDYSTATDWVVVSDATGDNQHILVGKNQVELDPAWSPDGARIFFSCNRFGRYLDLCASAVDGSGLRNYRYPEIDALGLPCSSTACFDWITQLKMSPDGSAVSFMGLDPTPNGQHRIWIGKTDGSSAVAANQNTIAYDHDWSPKGDRLLLDVESGADGFGFGLATENRDGSGYRQIDSFRDTDESASWSPDGALIIFDNQLYGGQQLLVMNADGSSRYKITSGSPHSFAPLWNPRARATGPLSGGAPARTDSVGPSSNRMPTVAPVASQTRSNVCHPANIGGHVRILCPLSP